jgi:hypothetical protein
MSLGADIKSRDAARAANKALNVTDPRPPGSSVPFGQHPADLPQSTGGGGRAFGGGSYGGGGYGGGGGGGSDYGGGGRVHERPQGSGLGAKCIDGSKDMRYSANWGHPKN